MAHEQKNERNIFWALPPSIRFSVDVMAAQGMSDAVITCSLRDACEKIERRHPGRGVNLRHHLATRLFADYLAMVRKANR